MRVMKKYVFFSIQAQGGGVVGFGGIMRFDPYNFWLIFLPTFFFSGYFPAPYDRIQDSKM